MLPGPYREAVSLIERFGWRSRVDFERVKRGGGEGCGSEADPGVPMDVTLRGGARPEWGERTKMLTRAGATAPA